MRLRTHLFHFLYNRNFKNWQEYYSQIRANGNAVAQKSLVEILSHARTNVPYYSNLFAKNQNSKTLLSSLPVLNKNILRTQFHELLSKDLHSRKPKKESSGGSMGTPVTFIHDHEYKEWTRAAEVNYYRKFLDIDLVDAPKVMLWGSPRDLLRSVKGFKSVINIYLRNIHFIDTFHLTEDSLVNAVNTINKRKPEMIRGFASALYLLCKTVKEKNLKIYTPPVIVSAAESLRPFMREMIEEVFQQKVFDYYGSREVGAIAGECKNGRYHIFNYNNWIEVVDSNDQPVKTGEEGRLLISNLHNYSMPLLRYEIGDMAIQGNGCDCGDESPTLNKMMGRISDYFVRKDTALVHGQQFTRLFYYKDWIAQFQVLQKSVDQFEIYYVCLTDKVDRDVLEINKNIRQIMDSDCDITWIKVNQVPKTPQGKLMFTRSLVNQ